MHIEVTYDNGSLIFEKPIRFKRKTFRITIVIPDEEIEIEPLSEQKVYGIGAELDKILGPFRRERKRVSPEEDKAVWHQHLVERYLK